MDFQENSTWAIWFQLISDKIYVKLRIFYSVSLPLTHAFFFSLSKVRLLHTSPSKDAKPLFNCLCPLLVSVYLWTQIHFQSTTKWNEFSGHSFLQVQGPIILVTHWCRTKTSVDSNSNLTHERSLRRLWCQLDAGSSKDWAVK